MDTMKLLLGATVALLLGALAVSWQGMNHGVKHAPADELARLQKQIKELSMEQDRLKLDKQLQQTREQAAQAPPVSNPEIEKLKAEAEKSRLALELMERERTAELEKKVKDEEELLGDNRKLESKDSELRRARMISNALLIGTIREYIPDAEFVTFEVLMPEQVQVGTILAIRRKTGILGQLKVSDVTAEGAIANPMGKFGSAQPQPGDELILPPPF
jgi:outer membrane murein-binding lipoprotein Lpp